MGLNKQKGNMYGFVTHTWNTIKGKCLHDCSYCYMKRFPQRELHFDEKELKTDLGTGNTIFVGSSCDMWADNINKEYIIKTISHCFKYSNSYLFQTKNPDGFIKYLDWFSLPCNTILCTTIETNRKNSLMGFTPSIQERVNAMMQLEKHKRMITIEPVMDFDIEIMVSIMLSIQPFQINIGADSGRNHLPEPPKNKILELMYALSELTIVHQKDNLKRLLK